MIAPVPFISPMIREDVLDCMLPRPQISTAEWITSSVNMPPDSKLKGRARLDLFPHAVGILEAFDDPDIERITLQTAAQVGKTTLAQFAVAKVGATNPHPMAWADADERSTKRVLKRTWRMFERTDGLAELCPPRHMQAGDQMQLPTFVVHGAWARSASSAADYGAFLVVLNETDKMVHSSTDAEADFRYLMAERAKGYIGSKIFEMSTPTLVGESYIEKQRLLGDNRGWFVPCPKCNHFQRLKTGDGKTPGGIRFLKLNKKLDPAKALESAWYECEKCRGKIHEHQRFEMLQGGLWVPEGCSIRRGKVVGTPSRKGSHASFGPLPTLASLLPGISIGLIAREHVTALTASPTERTERRRHFVNSWEGETWDPRPQRVTAHQLIERLGVDEPLRIVPEFARFVTVGVDVGRVNDNLIFHWVVSAWARQQGEGNRWGRRGQLVDTGITYGMDEFRGLLFEWFRDGYPHADGLPMRVSRVAIDSGDGDVSNTIYGLCDQFDGAEPVKGSSRSGFPDLFQLGFQRTNVPPKILAARKKAGLGDLLIVNTQRTQEWRVDQTSGLVTRDSPDFYGIPLEACEDTEFLDELINEYFENGQWLKSGANERGDALRYSLVAAEHYGTRHGAKWDRFPPRSNSEKAASQRRNRDTVKRAGLRNPSGQPFVATQRRQR
jgi:phage terminase large subunit GpA-like protein